MHTDFHDEILNEIFYGGFNADIKKCNYLSFLKTEVS